MIGYAQDGVKRSAVISIGAGESQVPFIRAAQTMGFSVVAVDRAPNAPGFEYCDMRIECSTHNTEAVKSKLDEFQNSYNYEAVLAYTTAAEARRTALEVREKLNLPGPTNELINISTKKSALRKFCNLHNFPVPFGTMFNGTLKEHEIKSWPVIVKPDITRSGKAGIRLCTDEANIKAYVAQAAKVSSNRAVEIESFIEGIDSTYLCWARKGKVYFIGWWDELIGIDTEGKIVSLGVSVPSVINNSTAHEEAEGIVSRLVSHFSEADAIILISFRVTMDGKIYIIEIHDYMAGDLIDGVLLPAANSEFDFYEFAVKSATGRINHVEPIIFKPTTLYYGNHKQKLSSTPAVAFSDYEIFQRLSLEENLALLPEIVNRRNLNLSIWPLHAEWLRCH